MEMCKEQIFTGRCGSYQCPRGVVDGLEGFCKQHATSRGIFQSDEKKEIFWVFRSEYDLTKQLVSFEGIVKSKIIKVVARENALQSVYDSQFHIEEIDKTIFRTRKEAIIAKANDLDNKANNFENKARETRKLKEKVLDMMILEPTNG